MRVLIALDGSACSNAVVSEAASRPWPTGTEFLVLTAIDPFFFTKAPLLLAEAKKDAEAALEESVESLRKNGVSLQIEIVMENPRHGIPKAAREWKADLILMGSHGRGAFGRLLMGSTAQAVLRRADCAVEIVRAGTQRASRESGGMRILAATDGSECAESALHAITGQSWPAGTEIRVVCVPELPLLTGAYPYYPPEVLAGAATANENHAKEAVERGVGIVKKTGVQVTGEVMESRESPVRAILGMADLWGADLIVVGSHGRHGVDRYLMGSVSEAVALHAHCSVEVVRGSAK